MDTREDFTAWVAVHERRLLRHAWLLTGDVGQAQDLVQTALLRCWPKWERVSRMDEPLAYVRRALTNTYLSWWRGRRLRELPAAVLPDRAATDPEGGLGSPLLNALARLPKGQRAVVVLRFAEDQSEAQTAALLGCSVGTVKSQTSRALKTLRADAALLREVDPA